MEGAGELPADLAGGPVVDVWFPQWRSAADLQDCRRRAARHCWRLAGSRWSVAHGLGEDGWRGLLPDAVREATEKRRLL
ncbi:MAG: hypothetical protein ACR2JO_01735 [Mycobacteriales bacterium]